MPRLYDATSWRNSVRYSYNVWHQLLILRLGRLHSTADICSLHTPAKFLSKRMYNTNTNSKQGNFKKLSFLWHERLDWTSQGSVSGTVCAQLHFFFRYFDGVQHLHGIGTFRKIFYEYSDARQPCCDMHVHNELLHPDKRFKNIMHWKCGWRNTRPMTSAN